MHLNSFFFLIPYSLKYDFINKTSVHPFTPLKYDCKDVPNIQSMAEEECSAVLSLNNTVMPLHKDVQYAQ